MIVRKICQWCGKPFVVQKTTTCFCSHRCSSLGYKEKIRERKRELKKMLEILTPKSAVEGQDFLSFAQVATLMGVTRQYIYKLVKENKLRASRISGKKSFIRRADIELMLKSKPYDRIMPKRIWKLPNTIQQNKLLISTVQEYDGVVRSLWTVVLPDILLHWYLHCGQSHSYWPCECRRMVQISSDIPTRTVGFNLGTINHLTFSRNAKNQRVILFGCQSILDE